jgi:hypothetical protein
MIAQVTGWGQGQMSQWACGFPRKITSRKGGEKWGAIRAFQFLVSRLPVRRFPRMGLGEAALYAASGLPRRNTSMTNHDESPLKTTLQMQKESEGRERTGEYAHFGLILLVIIAHIFLFVSFALRYPFVERA